MHHLDMMEMKEHSSNSTREGTPYNVNADIGCATYINKAMLSKCHTLLTCISQKIAPSLYNNKTLLPLRRSHEQKKGGGRGEKSTMTGQLLTSL